jgi:hypothetical protein
VGCGHRRALVNDQRVVYECIRSHSMVIVYEMNAFDCYEGWLINQVEEQKFLVYIVATLVEGDFLFGPA